MRLQVLTRDSTGSCPTTELTVTVAGERYTFDVASTGTFQCPEHVGEYLLDTSATVERYTDTTD